MKEIIINSRKFGPKSCLVDDEDYDWLISFCKWRLVPAQKARIFYVHGGYINKNNYYIMHRLIYSKYFTLPKDMDIDHKDGNPLNNQKHNLRIATNLENSRNRRKIEGTKDSIYKGVSKNRHGFWRARLDINGKKINIISSVPTERMAAIAYDIYAKKFFGEFARPNFYDISPEEIKEIDNLIESTKIENAKVSRFRGVYPDWRGKSWVAEIIKDKIKYRLGSFQNEEDAAKAYNQKAIELYGEKAKLNII